MNKIIGFNEEIQIFQTQSQFLEYFFKIIEQIFVFQLEKSKDQELSENLKIATLYFNTKQFLKVRRASKDSTKLKFKSELASSIKSYLKETDFDLFNKDFQFNN